jgi:RND family efflux transporter MFP subunit
MGIDDQLTSDLASLRIDRHPPPRSSGRVLPWLIALAVVGGLAYAGWRVAPAVEARLFKTEISVTEVALVSPAQAQVQLTSTGYVVPQIEVDVSSKLVGRVDKASIREGSAVKAGQILFELDASDQRVAVASAQARVAAARARAATARAQLAEIVLQRDREKRLADTGAVSQATADDLTARAKSLEEQVHAADADVSASQAEVSALATNLANTTIRAPIDGTVIAKPLLSGDVVSPGTSMAKIADFSSIVVETDVPEGRLHLVTKGRPCEIVLDAYPDRRWRGEVVEVSPQLNRAKASAFLEAPLDMAKLKDPPKHVVPGSALTDRGGAKVVFTLEQGSVRMIPVTLGKPFGDGFELVDGPAPGTKLVSQPPATLEDGQAVKERSP